MFDHFDGVGAGNEGLRQGCSALLHTLVKRAHLLLNQLGPHGLGPALSLVAQRYC